MSISPADLSAQRNAALQQFRDQTKQVENSLVKEISTTHANDLRQGTTDSAQLGTDEKGPSWESQAKAVKTISDLMQANPGLSVSEYKELLAKSGADQVLQAGAGIVPPPADGSGAGGSVSPAGAGGSQPAPTQQPIPFDNGGAGSQLLPPASAAAPPGAGDGTTPAPAPTGGAPAPAPNGTPTPVPPDNSPLQIAQQVQQMHSMWDQIRSIEAQMDIDDRKTQLDISNMYAAQWQSQMQSAQSNNLAMMAAGHGFVAAFIKNFVSA